MKYKEHGKSESKWVVNLFHKNSNLTLDGRTGLGEVSEY